MRKYAGLLSSILKSGFVRLVITRVLAIFIIVSVLIAAVAFFSFTTEIRRTILSDRRRQLTAVQQTISERMEEVTSIAYHIGTDPAFYLEPVPNHTVETPEMAQMLARYLVGNSYIEHLAFCRLAEPDTIYTAKGARSLSEFLVTGLGTDRSEVANLISSIHNDVNIRVAVTGSGENAYFTYGYPLPQLAAKPLAHVLMMIPVRVVKPLLETLFLNAHGEAAVFDAGGRIIYRTGNLEDTPDLTAFIQGDAAEKTAADASGQRYVLQKTVSETNGWTYVSVLRYSDTLSGLANKQVAFIAVILLLLVAAIVVMLASIIAQFRPISNLAVQMGQGGDGHGYVDERELLPHTIATLRDDSVQKQKYENAYYEAEAASKAKSAFLSSMSHDIRTPMNAIVGMTAIARKHIGDQAYVDTCLQKVQASSDYLLDIINNVLDMSRIESGHIPIAKEPVWIPALVDNVISLMSAGAEAKSQTLTADVGALRQAAVTGDSVHIVQVLVNILSNAVKFTPTGGKITLTVRQNPALDGQLAEYVFACSDTGVGIAPEFIGQVFDTFTRADDPDTVKTEGTGLGMAIAKKLVELMGGDITCQSQLGKGTTFTVRLPLETMAPSAAQALQREAEGRRGAPAGADEAVVNLTGKRILLVEDNEMNREIACHILAETGAEVRLAVNGREAVDMFAEHPAGYFNLILMDIQMPVMNGYAAAAAIRSLDRADAATVPVYAMTANTFDEDVRQVREAGMNGHIGKPYSPQQLYQVLAAAVP